MECSYESVYLEDCLITLEGWLSEIYKEIMCNLDVMAKLLEMNSVIVNWRIG